MKIKTLSSGSKGNCSIVLCDNTNIIIDMGISYLTLKRSLEENSLSFSNISVILITHCHKDHTRGLSTLINKTKLNVYIPEEMYDSLKEYVPKYRCIFIDDTFNINDVSIEPELAVRDLQERYKGIKKKLNPSYFNPILRGFNQDAKKTTSKESMRDIYTKYSHQLDAEFKQLDLDLDFCVATLKALNKSLSEYNKKNKVVK